MREPKFREKLSALDLIIKEVEKENNVKVEKKNIGKRHEKENCCIL